MEEAPRCSKLDREDIRDAILTLATAVTDAAFSARFEELRERLATEPDPAIRREVDDQLLSLISTWTFRVAKVTAELCAVVSRQQRQMTIVPAGGSYDAA